MSLSVETLAVARKYTDDSLAGAGAVAGVPCKIQSITAITGGNRVTFLWTDNNGDDHTSAMDVMNGVDGEDGKGIQSVTVNAQDHLIITYTDGTTVDAGQIEIHSSVDSVNGQTGTVVLDAEDVGALPDNTPIPSKTSDLTNDSGFATTSDVSTALANYTPTADLTTLLAAKQDTLTFDDAPTENSNNPVKSGGIYAVNQTLTSALTNNVNENGCKNILPNDAYSQTLANVSVSVNDNGEITVSGTANDTFKLYIHSFEDFLNDFLELNKDYVFSSGIPYNETTANITLKIMQTSGGSWVFIGNGDTFKLTSTPYRIEVIWWAPSGTVLSGTCKPMICLKSDYDLDPTYVPPTKTNRQLTKETTGLLDNLEVNGAVNILPIDLNFIKANNSAASWSGNACTHNGVTYTIDEANGKITVNGTASARSTLQVYNAIAGDLFKKSFKYLAKVFNNNFNTVNGYYMQLYMTNRPYTLIDAFTGNNFVVPDSFFDNSIRVSIQIVVENGKSVDNQVITPLIAFGNYTGGFEKYAKSNRELTEELTVKSGEITRLVSFSSLSSYRVRKYGKVVELYFAGTLSEAVNIWTDFLTVPEGFRPSHYVQIVSFNTYSSCKNLQLAPSGGIQSASNLSSGDFIRFSATYIID